MAAQFLHRHGIDLQAEMDRVQVERSSTPLAGDNTPDLGRAISQIKRLRRRDTSREGLWDLHLNLANVQCVRPHGRSDDTKEPKDSLDSNEAFVLPSLCHPHIHLDKCFLFSHPKYYDLEVVNGDFAEALQLTSRAKARFGEDDLLTRGEWVIKESIAAGVTHIRAFVEVDTTVKFRCLDAGLKLKHRFAPFCEIQICVFAQDPVFSEGKNHPQGKYLIEEALDRDGVDALGSTPYVESNPALMRMNLAWAISTAIQYKKHLDLHLDYNLDSAQSPLVFYALDLLREHWKARNDGRTIVFGHCTRLTLFTSEEWRRLRAAIGDLPLYFIGLPTSDLFMMSKPNEEDGGGKRVRGTLQIPQMIQKYGIRGAIGVNNVGNAFTPQGNCDPISIASTGVGIYQAGTKADIDVLFDCVSSMAKAAIGFPQPKNPFENSAPADFVLFKNPMSGDGTKLGSSRQRMTLQEIICDPPAHRQTIYRGRLAP